jgi:hypothetical protein
VGTAVEPAGALLSHQLQIEHLERDGAAGEVLSELPLFPNGLERPAGYRRRDHSGIELLRLSDGL